MQPNREWLLLRDMAYNIHRLRAHYEKHGADTKEAQALYDSLAGWAAVVSARSMYVSPQVEVA